MNDGGMGSPFGPGMNSADLEDLFSAFGGGRFGGGFGGPFAGFSGGGSNGGSRRGHTHSFGFSSNAG